MGPVWNLPVSSDMAGCKPAPRPNSSCSNFGKNSDVSTLALVIAGILGAIAAFTVCVALAIRKRNMQYWLGSYYFPSRGPTNQTSVIDSQSHRLTDEQPIDVFIAICDHYEPENGNADRQTAIARVRRWCDEYPALFDQFPDSDGRVPQHTFFFPQDQYAPEYLDMLAELCDAGYGDVDVHLHHDKDTADGLREKLESFRETLYHRHSLLRRDPETGEIVYGFIHGNWALCNSRPDGRWCGVNNEISILRETGCYADLTMPSAPSNTQTRTINSLYYAVEKTGRSKSHDTGTVAQVGVRPPANGLLMIQGPLSLDWRHRKWGVIPRIENADIHATKPPSFERMKLWLTADVHVAGRPDWKFVKLHTHGCKNGNIDTLLGSKTQNFHRDIRRHAQQHPSFRYHYVTAWEMAQLVHQAERDDEQAKLTQIPTDPVSVEK